MESIKQTFLLKFWKSLTSRHIQWLDKKVPVNIGHD
jgi:hypothetical protein